MFPRLTRHLFFAALCVLAALHAWMAVSVSDRIGVTSDEIAHLTAGRSYWAEQDYRLQPENGLLPQRLAGLPLALSDDIRYPAIHGDTDAAREWANGSVWNVGARFFYESGNDLPALLRQGRRMIALLGAACIVLIGLWARQLAGPCIGLAVATLATFSPTLLAHAGIATSDTAAGLGFLAATATWWRLCHRVTLARILCAGGAAGLLALAKYSSVLFAPIALLLLALRLTRRARLPVRLPGLAAFATRGWRRAPALLGAGVVSALLAIAVIWAGYGFRYEARGPRAPETARFDMAWDNVLIASPERTSFAQADGTGYADIPPLRPGVVQAFVRAARDARALPEAWLYGLAFVDRNARYRAGYLAGDWRMAGWAWFFPFAALIKSTPVELLLGLGVLAAWPVLLRGGRRDRRLAYHAAAPLLAMLVIGTAATTSNLNIGHRHILPLYPLGFVFAAIVFARAARLLHPRLGLATTVVFIAAQATAATQVRPHYLAYFNPLVGGPDGGHRYLVDSSLDWGQGLPAVRAWLDKNTSAGDPVFLSYFGSDRPSRLDIRATRFGDTYFRLGEPHVVLSQLTEGTYVFSATMWQRVYTHVRGPWTHGLERAFWRHHTFWLSPVPSAWEDGLTRETAPADLRMERLIDYEHLRFGRLCHYLRTRRPDAIIAHQYLVFRLSSEDIYAALFSPLSPHDQPAP
ncbi:MAG: hypothetical protein MUE42_00410 [Opitutaceae bacterium]|jgi:hypothetical protein|nr:hypothetical protein [Opitutaceae bacterium]